MKISKDWLVLMAYLLGAFITYGYAYRDGVRENQKRYPLLDPAFMVQSEAGFCAAFWPIYWPCHTSRIKWMEGK